ncbi:MAG: LysM peptidoglycan-binding domain-containing protein [Actinomycetota bacterium]|uniref:LysM peptidoglycan-binding domain-containing protein n=1 Tax=Mycobacterium lentiflavum TaxID=141349 RepID=A0ABY3URC8_MYCLN|nr:LysM peptidoglycan-binding domain-containing protein [Mycobacterium lentiflavum]MEE3064630.1 LysM peptidoglycan-binding domain-containing protein [Actinomycetota bacterium]ULP40995.1 LysM peptidoglycan-binding domain-containing protein [Mycobacterium lentiflavum]
MSDTLTEGQQLQRGQSLASTNGAYTLTLQDDGNLVLAARGEALWATATNGQDVQRAEVQRDGNFVLYTSDKPVWHTDTKGKKDVRLVLQDDGNLVLYAADGPAWSSHTQTDGPPPPAPAAEPADVLPDPAQPVAEPAPDPMSGPVGGTPDPAPHAAPEPAPRTYTVVSGDTMWAIAERYYGDGSKYQVIADASGVADPDLLHPGQVLTIP